MIKLVEIFNEIRVTRERKFIPGEKYSLSDDFLEVILEFEKYFINTHGQKMLRFKELNPVYNSRYSFNTTKKDDLESIKKLKRIYDKIR